MMSDLWREIVERLFDEELELADNAQADLDKIRALLAQARNNASPENKDERTAYGFAERGAEEWQRQCFERLGRALYAILRHRKLE